MKVINVRELERLQKRAEALGAKAQRLSLNADRLVDILEERRRRLILDMPDGKARFQVLDKAAEERHKVLRLAYIARHGLIQHLQ
jgi:hypothetical protein